ncbi:MAG TPA: hypothetical protein VGO09_05345 [Flavisolibacter sp.]|nr:hypothetical protein [Flavisolibacter sp.]
MADFYFIIFVLLCAALVAAIIIVPAYSFEYPFFMGCMFTIFILPQAISLKMNPGLVPADSISATYLMCVLCLLMIVLGYYFAPAIKLARFFDQPLELKKLIIITFVFTCVGYLFLELINRASGNAPHGNWTGALTIYYTIYQVINVAFAIFLFLAIKEKKSVYFLFALLAALPILQQIIFSGRRESTSLFVLSIALSLFFNRGMVPPRVLIISGLFFTMLVIPLIGNYRKFSDKDPIKAFSSMNIKEDFTRYYKEGKDLELSVAANMIDATDFYGSYDLGADYWNEMVFRYFPGQIFGKDMKVSLMAGSHGQDRFYHQFNPLNGLTTTCVGDSFRHFGYLGCFFYFFLGGFFRVLWQKAKEGNFMVRIFYVICMVQALLSVSHGTVNFLPGIFHMFVFIWIAVLFSKV